MQSLQLAPRVVLFEHVGGLALPIDSDDVSILLVRHARHLVTEQGRGTRVASLDHSLGLVVEYEAIVKEGPVEASENHNRLSVQLRATLSLSLGEEVHLRYVNQLPGGLSARHRGVEPLNRVEVGLCLVAYAGKGVDPPILERARRMVVAAVVHARLVEPRVEFDVVELDRARDIRVIDPRPSRHNKFVTEAAQRVPGSRVFHFVLFYTLRDLAVICADDFVALSQSLVSLRGVYPAAN